MKTIIIALVSCLAFSIAQAADLLGVPRIVDGDTLAIGATKIRLEGIDAPETDQVCLNANGVRWTCGIDARDKLAAHIAGREINCTSNGTDVYRRTLATCYLAGEDLNGWLVQQGWALAYVKYSSAYRQVEEDARVNQRGIWQGAFIAPWDWRHRNNKTVILGAFSVPFDARAILLAPPGLKERLQPNARLRETSTAKVSGFIIRSTKTLTPELKWIKAAVGDGSAHRRKRKLRGGGEHAGETGLPTSGT